MKYFILFIFLFVIISCRYDSYSPPEPTNQNNFDYEIDHFEKPEKADIYRLGDTVPIKYRNFGFSDRVDIHIVKKSQVRYTIGSDVIKNGIYEWHTSEQTRPSVHYQVKIVSKDDPEVYIISESFGVISN